MKFPKNLLGLFLLLFCISIYLGCQKELKDVKIGTIDIAEDLQALESTLIEYQFYIDLDSVAPYEPDPDEDTTSIFLIESHPSSSPGYDVLMIIHTFTDIENYYNYSDSLEYYDIRTYGQLLDHWAHVADSLNMDSIIASVDSIPSWWDDLQTDIYYDYFPEELGNATLRGLVTILNKCWRGCPLPGDCFDQNCSNHSAVSTFPSGIPSLWLWGLKNKVSSFASGLVGGYNTCFKKSFFRKRLWKHWDFYGLSCIDLCGSPLGKFNDKGNSWWNAGL